MLFVLIINNKNKCYINFLSLLIIYVIFIYCSKLIFQENTYYII